MDAIKRFEKLAAQDRFKGWPLIGEQELGSKVPFFGQLLHYNLKTGNGIEHYTSILRHFGWVVVFGVTTQNQVVTIVQWKPGVNQASWELSPGGIGRINPETPQEEILNRTKEFYLRETGFGGGSWERLGHILVESGKYRGAGPNDHGFRAHMYLATGLEDQGEKRNPNPNEIIENLLVPIEEFWNVIDSGLFCEESALPCALLALRKLGK